MIHRYFARQSVGLLVVLFFAPSHGQSKLIQVTSPATATLPNAASTRTDIVKGEKSVSPPTLIYSVEPVISEAARKVLGTATVIVDCYIEADGKTSNVHIVQIKADLRRGSNELVNQSLGDSAVDAVKRYKFKPAIKDGKPVAVELNVPITFRH